ncbi:baseplate assembly protein [Photobacterium leiognathi]|uniref:baseplate assembly protein n=1 Tax=Photobacterium leiognathi TaxID=553611 RepID=UPI0027396D7A|nr:baseplate J/gp47 family protein [Photobacterium leiognathi]
MTIRDIRQLPPPSVKEPLDFEQVLQAKKAAFQQRQPTWNADVESDPTVKQLEVASYAEVVGRQRVNDAALSVMMPWARGDNLEGLAHFFDEKRRVIEPANPEAIPPTPAVFESDEALFERCMLKWYSISTAGAQQSYEYFARAASPKVKDAKAHRIKGGSVGVVVLSTEGNGAADSSLLAAVEANINTEERRPLCSSAQAISAQINEYSINAILKISNPTAVDSILKQAQKNADEYALKSHRIGALVSASAYDAAMHIGGVEDVDLQGFENIQCDMLTAPFCTSITIKQATPEVING